MSKERNQVSVDNLPVLKESQKAKNYFFSPAKEFQRQNYQNSNFNGVAKSSDKTNFESYLKEKYEKQIQFEQSMQNKTNSYVNTMNTTMAQKIIERIFVSNPQKKLSSQQASQNASPQQVLQKSIQNMTTKFSLKSMLLQNQVGLTPQKKNLVGQLNMNSPQKSQIIPLNEEVDDAKMKTKLKNEQWTSTVEIKNLRSQCSIPSEPQSKCTSPSKLRISMPLIEEIQHLSQEERQYKQKRNPQQKIMQKQMQELCRVNKQLEKMKHTKTNSLGFLPSSSYLQSTLNLCQSNIGSSGQIVEQTNQVKTRPLAKKHYKNINNHNNNNNQDISECSSITQIAASTNGNKPTKEPSLDDIHLNFAEEPFLRKSFNNSVNTNSQRNKINLNSNNNPPNFTQSLTNSSRKEKEGNFSHHEDQKISEQLNGQQYLINKPKIGKVINLKNNQQQQSSEVTKTEHTQISNIPLNSPKEEFFDTEVERRRASYIASLNQLEPNSRSESLIEPLTTQKPKENRLFLHIPKKKQCSSMINLDQQEQDYDERPGSKSPAKSRTLKNIKDNITINHLSHHIESDSLYEINEDIDSNIFKNSKLKSNSHQQLFKSQSNYINLGKAISYQQSGQQSPGQQSPLMKNVSPKDIAKNLYSLQLKAQSPSNRKEQLIQQLFLQKQKSIKLNQFSNAISYQPSSLNSPHSRLSPQRERESFIQLNSSNMKINNLNGSFVPHSPTILTPKQDLSPLGSTVKQDFTSVANVNPTNPYMLNLDLLKIPSQPQRDLLDSASNCSSNTPRMKSLVSSPFSPTKLQKVQSNNNLFTRSRQRQVSSIELTVNGGYHSNQGLLNKILKKNTQNFSHSRNNSTNNQPATHNFESNNPVTGNSNITVQSHNHININLKALNSSSNSSNQHFSFSSSNLTPLNQNQKKKSIKINTNSYLQMDQNGQQSFSNTALLSPQYESSASMSQGNTFMQDCSSSKLKFYSTVHSNQLRFSIDELCQGLEIYILKDIEIMKELKQVEIDSSSFTFYVSKYLQSSQNELPIQISSKSRDKLVLFKISTLLFERLRVIITNKMNDMNFEQNNKDKILQIFEGNKLQIIASNVFEEIGGKRQLKQLIQTVIKDIKDNTNIPILNQFSDQKTLIENATNFFMYLFKGEYEQVGIQSEKFLEKNYNVTMIEYFLLKNFTYNSLIRDQTLIKEVILRILEKIESVRSSLVQNYDDNLILNSESQMQSLLFDLGIHSISVHKFIKPLKNKILPESQYDPFSYYLKQEVKYLITNPKLRKMARTAEANLKSKDDFYKVSFHFLDILKKQKSIKFTANQLLNVEVRVLKVAILLGLEEDYLGLFKDITDLEKQLLEEIDLYHQQNSRTLSIPDMKASLDIKFLLFIIEFTFNQFSVFNSYDISIAKKFYSLNYDIIITQISSLESLLLKRKKESIHFIQIQQKIPQFINLLKKIFIST